MTEKEAWAYLAECCDRAVEENRTDAHNRLLIRVVEEDVFGLCPAVSILGKSANGVDLDTEERMYHRISPYKKLKIGMAMYAFHPNIEGAKQRAALCRKFAGEWSSV